MSRRPSIACSVTIPDLELVRANLGPELTGQSTLGKLKRLVATVPALWTIVRLGVLVKRRGIEIIHTSDRPRDAFVAVVLGRLTGRPLDRPRARRLRPVLDGPAVAVVAGPRRRARRRLRVRRADARRRRHGPGAGPRRDATASTSPAGTRAPTAPRRAGASGSTPDAPLLITICRLFPEKGPADVIEAVARLRDELPGIRLLIVGTDLTGSTYSEDLRLLAADLGVSDHVALLGRRDDIEELLAAADVFVMPSFEEPFGLVFCEAMAMGKPVVALDDGGTVEIVEHGRTGLLSSRGDLDALTANLRALLLDPARRAAMGAAGRAAWSPSG